MAPGGKRGGPLPVTVIGGYLGAGKTTLVNAMLRQAGGRRLAIMVNEFGALPIDSSLVEAADDRIVSLTGGCVCCSYGEDMVSSLAMLAALEPRPDHVLLEASGVAFPGAIAGTVGLLADFALDGTVVLADAETVRRRAADRYVGSTIRQQLAQADLILLNKCDLAADPDAVEAWLGEAAPAARIIRAERADVPINVVLGARPDNAAVRADGRFRDHTAGYVAAELDPPAGADPEALARLLADPAHRLLRAKGFVRRADGAMAAIQVVGSRWTVSEAPPEAPVGLVCIGMKEQADPSAIRRAIREAEAGTPAFG
ncbi:MAG: GTP-binding protein [Rhodospirillaceae bacterium]|nr:GTP-binding protein [Rhodospirillaceae bacterium]MYH38603.1 GTP-binding protein [Rhodospirillaceae bacterium]MYK13051.1 GTP-binding protein [Rhodospirillaceae bacterium]